MSIIKDLLKGPGNVAWDLGRLAVALGTGSVVASVVWNILLGLPIELGPTGLPGGLGAFFGGCAALIYAKDRAGSENKVANAVVEATPAAPPAKSAQVKADEIKDAAP